VPTPVLLIQTQYAELLERVESAAFEEAFPEPGNFLSKQVTGRTYWYFQAPRVAGQPRPQRYVGPENPELLSRIEVHRRQVQDHKERRALVTTLVRSGRMPQPLPRMGQVVESLARAGLFRLRAVLVGTMAYQCYPAMLGLRLKQAQLTTSDVDIAQFLSISVAVGDRMADPLTVLRAVDPTFGPAPSLNDREPPCSYLAANALKVEFLTPNRGADTDSSTHLPALQTQAQPLRFLDFLIYEATPAVLLHGEGVLVNVPRPERFAVHKLILAPRRTVAEAKSAKDLRQAAELLAWLVEFRPHDLRDAWQGARDRGPSWRDLLTAGFAQVPEVIQASVRKVVDS
jgi:hypothetical protein